MGPAGDGYAARDCRLLSLRSQGEARISRGEVQRLAYAVGAAAKDNGLGAPIAGGQEGVCQGAERIVDGARAGAAEPGRALCWRR